ncbi:hypothetical protein BGX38DRAFT_1265923 [Terfezia claveryi]|nr:hypothetical protein BGX38DRAFT_1265923 [Terfezia claveryi]
MRTSHAPQHITSGPLRPQCGFKSSRRTGFLLILGGCYVAGMLGRARDGKEVSKGIRRCGRGVCSATSWVEESPRMKSTAM